jgi:hypothetical protein
VSATLSGAIPPDLPLPPSPSRLGGFYSACLSGWMVIRRNWLVSVLVAFGFLLRLAAMLAYYPSILYIDSYDYIVRAYTLDPTGNDPVGYSVFLRVMLKFTNLSTVVAVQHLCGLGVAIAIYMLLRRYDVRRWLCALAVAPVLLDGYQVQIEQNILSDSLYETLIVAGIVVLAWYRRPPIWAYPIGGALLGMTVPVRTVGEMLFVATVVFALTVARGWRRKAVAVLFAAAGFAVPIIGYAGYYYSVTGTPGIAGQGYNNMYGRAAMVANCAELPLTPEERVLCPTQPLGQRIGIDYYINGPSSPLMQQKYREVYGEPHIDIPQATSGFVDEVLAHQFGTFAHSVADDFVHSFSPQSHVSASVVPASRWQFQTVYPIYPPGFTLQTAKLVDALGGQGPIHMDVALAGDLRAYQLNGGSTPGPLLGVFTLLGVVCCCAWSKRVKASGLRPVCLLITLAGLVPLFVSDLFQYTVRYQMPATVILPAAGAIGLTALLHRPEKIKTAVVIYGGVRPGWSNVPQEGDGGGTGGFPAAIAADGRAIPADGRAIAVGGSGGAEGEAEQERQRLASEVGTGKGEDAAAAQGVAPAQPTEAMAVTSPGPVEELGELQVSGVSGADAADVGVVGAAGESAVPGESETSVVEVRDLVDAGGAGELVELEVSGADLGVAEEFEAAGMNGSELGDAAAVGKEADVAAEGLAAGEAQSTPAERAAAQGQPAQTAPSAQTAQSVQTAPSAPWISPVGAPPESAAAANGGSASPAAPASALTTTEDHASNATHADP